MRLLVPYRAECPETTAALSAPCPASYSTPSPHLICCFAPYCRTSEQYQYVQSVTVGRITIQLPGALAFPCHGHFPLFPYMLRTARYHDQRPVLSPMPSQHESRDFELFSITLPPFSPFLCSPAIPFCMRV